LYFEELEPRLLYSADLAGAIDTEVPEQDVEEEPVITADLESTEESDAAQQEEDQESVPSTLSTEPAEPTEETSQADTTLGSSAEENKDSVAVTADDSNAAPVITMPDTAVNYAPGDPPAILAPAATVGDDDSENFFQGTLSVSVSEGGTDDDQLLIVEGGDVSLLNNNIKVEQKLVGSFAGGSDGAALIISWSPQATPECAEAVLRQIAYGNDSAGPAPVSRTVDFVLTDGDGGTSNIVQAAINITAEAGGDTGEGDTGGSEMTVPGDDPPVDEQDDPPVENPEPDPGQGDTGGNEATVPVDDPPVEPSVENPEPNPSGDDQIPGDEQQDPPPAGSEISTAPVSPIEPVMVPTAEEAVPDNFAEFLSGTEEGSLRQDVPDGSQVTGDPAGGKSAAASEQAEEITVGLPDQPSGRVPQVHDAPDGRIVETLKTTMSRLLEFFAPSAAIAAPAPPLGPDPAVHDMPAAGDMICREVEVMRQEMEEAFLQSNRAGKLMAYTTTGVSLSLAAGIARYFCQSGSLLSGFLATIPLWKGFDPVAVLRTPKNDRKKAGATFPSVGVEPIEQKAETMFAAGGEA